MCIYRPNFPPVIKKAARQMFECMKEAGKPVADAAAEYVKSYFRKDKINGKAGKDQTAA
jgi:hypothetical protein